MRFIVRYNVLFLLFFISKAVFAQQKEANIWYFGRFLGLDFNSGTATPLNNGKINTLEGVATISDANGNLLFYTDGITIWNKVHQVMPNGTGLFGNPSSTQSAVIVPKIGDPLRYYVFTVDQLSGPRGLTYSVVNMSLAGGNGDVELKNVPLQLNVTEKITAVRHCNNRDIWVVAHGSASDIYYSFLVTTSGISATPVISHTGTVLPGVVPPSSQDSSSLGYLKASPDGKRIAAAHWTVSADVSDFNNATGVVSNSFNLFLPTERYLLAYGIEFSPDSKLVYTTVFYTDPVNAQKSNALLQYDVSLGTPAAVQASKQTISSSSDPIQVYSALQVAPDGKMYMAKYLYPSIAVIDNPNVYGTGCNFVSNAITYSQPGQQCTFGLPTFIQSYFYPVDSFTHTVSCPGATVSFNYNQPGNVSSVLWNFGDLASGANNSSVLTNPVHQFTAPGTYNVLLIKFTNCGPDTIRKQIVADTLYVNLGNDTTVCGGTSLVLNSTASAGTNTYLWQDGSTNPSLTVTTAGLYWVEVRNNMSCVKRDSINVAFAPIPVFSLGSDTTICQGFVLNASSVNATSYLWSTGSTNPSIMVSQVGLYWCEVVKNGCMFRDSMAVTGTKPSPVVNLGNDQTLCEGSTATLDATYPNATYRWQDGTTQPTYTVANQGVYHVELDLSGCKKSDTIRVDYNLKPVFTLGPDQYICPGNNIVLSPQVNASWQLTWQDGSTNPTYTVTQPGNYSLTATNACGSRQDEITVSNGVCKVHVPTGFTPNNDGKNDVFRVLGTETTTSFSLRIFNNWGQLVFETKDRTRGWDGRFNGAEAPSSVFVYLVNYTDINATTPQILKGTFVLIR